MAGSTKADIHDHARARLTEGVPVSCRQALVQRGNNPEQIDTMSEDSRN